MSTGAADLSTLPQRQGARPETHHQMPHQQLSQNAGADLQERLFEQIASLNGVVVGPSHVSVPGARAFHLDPDHAGGPPEAFMVGTEFAHLHPASDGSLHLVLPEPQAREVIAKGWGEFHPLVEQGVMPPTNVMVYGPRDEAELESVMDIVLAAYVNAAG
ncbi:MAG: luciferase family protein [Candidatus Dormiibacterota bacterium]